MNRFEKVAFVTACLILAAVILSLQGCKDEDFITTSYKSLAIAGSTYDAVMTASADAYSQGIINEEQKDDLLTYAGRFYGIYHPARIALREYALMVQKDPEGAETATLKSKVARLIGDLVAETPKLADYARRLGVNLPEVF